MLQQECPLFACFVCSQEGGLSGCFLFLNALKGSSQSQEDAHGRDGADKDEASKENSVLLRHGHVAEAKGIENIFHGTKGPR